MKVKFTLPHPEKEKSKTWTVTPVTSSERDKPPGNTQTHQRGNAIKTTKYTILTFLPKNLFEQFHRFANIYFLFIVILNWIPQVNAFGKEIAMLPLLFVLAVTAIKDIIEDHQRYKSDKTINNRICSVYDRDIDMFECNLVEIIERCFPKLGIDKLSGETNTFVGKKWRQVVVGDILKVGCDEMFPADLLLLQSSDISGSCHVSTANLDGENNLKQKQLPKGFVDNDDAGNLGSNLYDFQLKCQPPDNHIHSFYGFLVHRDGEQTGVDKNNVALRGCVLKNTQYITGLVVYAGHDTKAMLNNSGPRYKRSKLEKEINKDVIACVFILFILCLSGAIGCGVWTYDFKEFEKIMSTNEAESPGEEGFLRFWTFVIVLQVIIPISLYVSVEIVKLGQVYFINRDKGLFYEESKQYPICRATNINEDLGQIRYIFSDKTGTLTENKMEFKRFSVGGMTFSHPSAESDNELETSCNLLRDHYVKENDSNDANWNEFFTALAICNTVVVSSKPEIVTEDETMQTPMDTPRENDKPEPEANKRLSLQHQLSNGSLVNGYPNHDDFRGRSYTSIPEILINRSISIRQQTSNGDALISSYLHPEGRERVLSKAAMERLSRSLESISSWLHYGLTPAYEFESPDEGALVKAATHYGYKLADRSQEQIFFSLPSGDIRIYDVLQILQFDSARKRMSIIVRDGQGKIKVYSKGADTAILTQLKAGQGRVHAATEEHLETYAREGLRTLCIAKKELTEEEYKDWLENHKEAEVALVDRDKKLADSAERMEKGFELLGATGIEDRLQEGVPETIASLRDAGIRIWILTGDKQETAVNIGFSCKLIDPSMELITINCTSKAECNDLLDQISERLETTWQNLTMSPTHSLSSEGSTIARPPLSLIIDGKTLAFALETPLDKKFLAIAKRCETVICCRAAPLQKASVVQLIRENLHVMSLAIGDGANDVSMLQMAEVGVGIAGQEGVQAVMASDFVLGRFRFLQRLLLLHGFWCYDRIARMIVYFFYKNMMFVALLFWYQLYNGFSGSNAIDDVSLILYNLAFTSVPPIVTGIFDQNLSEEAVLRRPVLYQWGQYGKAYSRKLFWISILDAVYQSLVLFFIPYFTFYDLTFGKIVVGVAFHQFAVITANMHIAIETPNWTIIHVVFILGSVVVSFLYYFVYCAVSPLFPVYWAIFEIMKTSEFWLLILMCPTLAILPRLVYRALQSSFFPSVIQIVKSKNSEKIKKDRESVRASNNGHVERQSSTPM